MMETFLRKSMHAFSALALLSSLAYVFIYPLDWQVSVPFILFIAFSVIIQIWLHKQLVLCYTLSLFTLLISWRIAGLYQVPWWVDIPYSFLFCLKLLYFFYLAYTDIYDIEHEAFDDLPEHYMIPDEWQLLFIRLYIGYDLVPHFTEKLFAGSVRNADIAAFTALGIPDALPLVLLAGLIEFGAALSISCGFLIRAGAIGFSFYLLVASFLGHHFSDGFIWASPGGGWEYPVLLIILILSFALFAPYKFSVDINLQRHYKLPNWLIFLMGKAKFPPKL